MVKTWYNFKIVAKQVQAQQTKPFSCLSRHMYKYQIKIFFKNYLASTRKIIFDEIRQMTTIFKHLNNLKAQKRPKPTVICVLSMYLIHDNSMSSSVLRGMMISQDIMLC